MFRLKNIGKIRMDLRDIRIFCGRYFPFVVIPLSYARIIATDMVPTAGVDERGVLAINPSWWGNLKMEGKRFIAIHECLHCVLCHPFRMKGFDRDLYNFVADGKVNNGISSASVSGVDYDYRSVVTLNTLATITGLRVEDLEKMSTEEIVRVLEKNEGKDGSTVEQKKNGEGGCGDIGDDLIPGTVEGEVIQEGDRSVNQPKNREELREVWKRLCEKAKAFAKQAGNMPAGLERIVDEVLEVKPPWQVTVRFGLRNSSKFDSSFAYPNRRSDDLPGPLNYRYTLWCLIDTSGSIRQEELKYFLGIAKHEARNASLRVIAWDAQSHEVLRAESPQQVARKVAAKMKGGGGTVCKPVLEKVYRLMSNGDAVIMLTDGEIFDAEKSETRIWFRRVSA
ncbi:MAG: VWA-like domain-containing protein, partial [Candidatus Bathyarchaeia archaeon]